MLIALQNGVEELEDELLLLAREQLDLLELALELRAAGRALSVRRSARCPGVPRRRLRERRPAR
ncbi:MAG: hypothetical protein KF756_10360 [Acidobacteria bacterium]|nr:hypothetical protein [Acidobacteriota bacterium]